MCILVYFVSEFEGPEADHIKRDIMAQERFSNMSESTAFDATKALFKISGAGNKKKLMIKKDIPKRLKEVSYLFIFINLICLALNIWPTYYTIV
jgi:hypothetical protein